jgi:hypothetical protein
VLQHYPATFCCCRSTTFATKYLEELHERKKVAQPCAEGGGMIVAAATGELQDNSKTDS